MTRKPQPATFEILGLHVEGGALRLCFGFDVHMRISGLGFRVRAEDKDNTRNAEP